MSRYQKPSYEIEQTIKEVKQLKRDVKSYGTPDFASKWALYSIQKFEQDLQDEFKAAKLIESPYDAKLAVDGGPVTDHRINGKFFGNLLVSMQELVDSIAASVGNNGKSRKNLKEKNQLALAAVGAGSFEASFVLPRIAKDKTDILVEVEPEQIVLDQLNKFFDGDIEIDLSADILMNNSVRSHYQKVISLLSSESASVSLRTRDCPHAVILNARQAAKRNEWINALQTNTVPRILTGELIAGNMRTSSFEISAGGEKIIGRASGEATKQMRGISLGETVTAIVQVTTTTHEDAGFGPRISFFLKGIQADPTLFSSIESGDGT